MPEQLIITRLSSADPRIQIRDLEPADEPGVLALFSASRDWFVAATGLPAGPGDVQSLFYALPEGAAIETKRILVATVGDRIAAVIDAVLRHPHPRACAVGVFLVHPELRRRGLGRRVATTLLAELAERGITEVTAGVPEGWAPGRAFLTALGFTFDAPRRPVNANRNIARGEGPVVPARLVLEPPGGRPRSRHWNPLR